MTDTPTGRTVECCLDVFVRQSDALTHRVPSGEGRGDGSGQRTAGAVIVVRGDTFTNKLVDTVGIGEDIGYEFVVEMPTF
jgi:hypothetical protein